VGQVVNSLNRARRTLSRRAGIHLAHWGLTLERTAKSEGFEALLLRRLAQLKRSNETFFFLQIGANDGISHDPIHAFVSAFKIAGIVVEPLPDVFERLCATYSKHPQIKKLNIAVHEELERVTLYRPAKDSGDENSGIASLNQDRFKLTSARSGVQEEDIQAVEVPAMSISRLLETEQVKHLDLLQIDTEGYDMQILAGLDLTQHQPSIIRFEHGVYSGVPARDELRETLLRLYDHGYSVAMERVDAVAWLHADVAKRRA
jgi:FkbM family methyltransferase